MKTKFLDKRICRQTPVAETSFHYGAGRKIIYDFPCGLPPAKNLKSSFSLPLSGEAGGKGVRGEVRPPSPLMKSVRVFSNTHRDCDGKITLHKRKLY